MEVTYLVGSREPVSTGRLAPQLTPGPLRQSHCCRVTERSPRLSPFSNVTAHKGAQQVTQLSNPAQSDISRLCICDMSIQATAIAACLGIVVHR